MNRCDTSAVHRYSLKLANYHDTAALTQEMDFVRRCITADSFAIDIGANHGVYSLTIAKVASAGAVWAFEPASLTADLLETSKNVNEFHHMTVCREAVSDKPGVADFVIEGAASELNHLVFDGATGGKPTEKVQLTTLDDCMQQYAWTRMDFIKIDAEGAELQILEGAKLFFAELSPLVMFE